MSTIQTPTTTAATEGNSKPKSAPKLTPAEILLRSMTARKIAASGLKGKKPSMHLTFDDEGHGKDVLSSSTPKKRKESEGPIEPTASKESKKAKKARQAKELQAAAGPGKRAQALDYIRLFKENRTDWKFNKKHQIWVLQNMYDHEAVPDQDFQVLLEYVKDIEGSAREKTLSGARAICQQSCGNSLTGYAVPTGDAGDDDDDFDAERLLASAPKTPTADEDPKVQRAKAIVNALSL